MHCIKCGNLIPDGESVCKVCGMDFSILDKVRESLIDNKSGYTGGDKTPQENQQPQPKARKCPKCGTFLGDDAAFCTRCGFQVDDRITEKRSVTGRPKKSGSDKAYIIAAACGMFALTALVLVTSNFGIVNKSMMPHNKPEVQAVTAIETPVPEPEVIPTEVPTEVPVQTLESRGTSQPIPEDIREFMLGRTMTPNDTIGFDDLSYLTIPYIDFNDEYQKGHMVVAADLAEEVLDIFEELYNIRYPIERMELVDYFFDKQTEELDSPDRASMGNNNTSSFYYRVVSGTTNLSNHARGRAIDLNTKVNPYVTPNGYVSPRNAEKYADRSCEGWTDVEKRAFIGPDTEVYRIFISHGWEWGGEIWDEKDYQHFQKP